MKKLLIAIPLIGFLAPFFVFQLLYQGPWETILFKDNLVHTLLVFLITSFSFYSAFFAYRLYEEKRDPRIFFSSLALFSLGFIFLLHGALIFFTILPLSLHETIFDITEHYSLLLAALLFFGMIFPWNGRKEKLYRNRLNVYGALISALFLGTARLIFWPGASYALYGIIDSVVWLTAVLFFILLLFFCREFAKTKDSFSLYLIAAFAILINSGVIPLFYKEWNLLWWFSHFVLAAGFTVIFLGLIQSKDKELSLNEFFSGQTPWHKKIGTKLLITMLTTASLPFFVFGILSVISVEQDLRKEINSKLLVLAEAKESQVFAFLDFIGLRTLDFASDGATRDGVRDIVAGKIGSVENLNYHLTHNKKPLDETLAGIFVADLKGKIIASTNEKDIGKDESKDDYFVEGRKKLFVSDFESHEHFGVKNTFIASVPLKDRQSNEIIGVLINVFYAARLQNIFSGEFQIEKGALTAAKGLTKTTEIYLVNKNKKMFVHPSQHSVNDKHFVEGLVDTAPVRACLEKSEEITDQYINYAGEQVVGTSMCFKDRNWTLIVEINAKEMFLPINLLKFRFSLMIFLFFILVTSRIFVFSDRLTRPLRQLHEASEIITKGNLDYRVDIKTGDEVEQLAGAFNEMTTNLKKNIRGLKKEQARLTAALNSISLGFIIADLSHNIILKNRAISDILGFGDEELTMEAVAKRLKKNFDLKFYYEKCVKEKKAVDIKNIQFGPKFLRVFLAPIVMLQNSEEIIGCALLIENITEAKIMERAKEEFFAVASHELRTPLTAIRGNMSMIKQFFAKELKNNDLKEMIDDSYESSVRLISIINDFLNVSALETGKITFKKERVDLAALIAESIHEFESLVHEKNLYLKVETAKILLPLAFADKDRTKQIIVNLLSNALNFTKSGGITVELKCNGAMAEVYVHDTGAGILLQYQTLLFRKFQQAGEKVLARDVAKGTGLGLYISKLIVEAMDGKIWLERSEPGKGSTFAFALPLAL